MCADWLSFPVLVFLLITSTPFSYTIPSTTPGWRADSIKAIFLLSDSPFHNPDTDFGYPGHNFPDTSGILLANGVDFGGISMPGHYGIADMGNIAALTGGVLISYSYNLSNDVDTALSYIIGY